MLDKLKSNITAIVSIIVLITGLIDTFNKLERTVAESNTWKAAAIYHANEDQNCSK